MIRRNLFWKIVALGAAVALWAYVNSERNPHTRKPFSIPIEVRNLAKGYEADFVDNRNADVTIEGLKAVVDSVTPQDVRVWISLPSVKAGQAVSVESPTVRAHVARVPEGSLDVTVSPKRAKLRVEAVRWKQLPVEVKFLTAPPLGYAFSDPVIAPAMVAVSGKTSAVSRVKKVICAVTCDERNGQMDEMAPISPVDAQGDVVNDVTLDADRVRLKVRFVEAAARKAVIVSPDVTGQPKFPARVTSVNSTPPFVTVEGKPSVLIDMSTAATESVSIDGATGTLTREVRLRLPAGVRIVGRSRVRVTVQISAPQQ